MLQPSYIAQIIRESKQRATNKMQLTDPTGRSYHLKITGPRKNIFPFQSH